MRTTSLLTVALLAACGGNPLAAPSHGEMDLALSARGVPGATNIAYNVSLIGPDGTLLWNQTIDSATYGTGDGAASFVGTCDASNGGLNTVEVTILDIQPLAPDAWSVPSGASTATFICDANADVFVNVELFVAILDETVGFVDLTLDTSAIQCAAKLDCLYADGTLPTLYADPATGERLPTTILALSCIAGTDGQQTALYLDDVVLTCDGNVYPLSAAAGQGPAVPPLLAGTLVSSTEGADGSTSWAMQLGWDLASGFGDVGGPSNCSVSAIGTASEAPLAGNTTPSGVSYPLVTWDVPLTDVGGALTCSQHPLKGGNGVDVGFTLPTSPVTLPHGFGAGASGGGGGGGGVDADADGFTIADGDCDDAAPNVFPGAPEIVDGVDNDCDGLIDNGVSGDGCIIDADCTPGLVCESETCITEGSLRFTLQWDDATDCDLHVLRPDGEEIWFTNPMSASGDGLLDVDNQLGGAGSIENIFFNSPAPGVYSYSVVNYNGLADCNATLNVTDSANGIFVSSIDFVGGGTPAPGVPGTVFTYILP